MSKGTSIYIDHETREDLQKIIEMTGRNLSGQIRWMVDAALKELDLKKPEEKQDS